MSVAALHADVWRFTAIGTAWSIDTSRELSATEKQAIDALIARFDREWSRFREDSDVAALARGERTVPKPPDADAMLGAFRTASAMTGGAVNPLIGGALAARGYDAAYSFVDRGAEPAPAAWQDVLRHDEAGLHLSMPATVDVGALGKGRLVDRVADLLRSWELDSFVVDASGDLVVHGSDERIALEHPYDRTRAIGIWNVSEGALCASATNRRTWGDRLHHVLDARTGEPVRTIAATWVVAGTAMHADAVATALFFDGGEALAAEWGADWVRMTTSGTVETSRRATARLFR